MKRKKNIKYTRIIQGENGNGSTGFFVEGGGDKASVIDQCQPSKVILERKNKQIKMGGGWERGE